MAGADHDDLDEDEAEAGPAAPPTVFGFEAAPAGCGINAALVFAILAAPYLLLFDFSGCEAWDTLCQAGRQPAAMWRALIALLAAAALFGSLIAALIRRRLRVLAAGGSNRSPLWAVFAASLILAVPFGSTLALLLISWIAGMGE